MSETVDLEGACLCGAVRVSLGDVEPHVDACHCSMCRTWGGGPLYTTAMTKKAEFAGGEHVARFASSDWAERGFCKTCGTHLFYYFKPMGVYVCPAGLFDPTRAMPLKAELFVDETPAHLTGAEERMTGAEVRAKFGIG